MNCGRDASELSVELSAVGVTEVIIVVLLVVELVFVVFVFVVILIVVIVSVVDVDERNRVKVFVGVVVKHNHALELEFLCIVVVELRKSEATTSVLGDPIPENFPLVVSRHVVMHYALSMTVGQAGLAISISSFCGDNMQMKKEDHRNCWHKKRIMIDDKKGNTLRKATDVVGEPGAVVETEGAGGRDNKKGNASGKSSDGNGESGALEIEGAGVLEDARVIVVDEVASYVEKYAQKKSGEIDLWLSGAEAVRELKEKVARQQFYRSLEEPLHSRGKLHVHTALFQGDMRFMQPVERCLWEGDIESIVERCLWEGDIESIEEVD
jgi:hypothetical protein